MTHNRIKAKHSIQRRSKGKRELPCVHLGDHVHDTAHTHTQPTQRKGNSQQLKTALKHLQQCNDTVETTQKQIPNSFTSAEKQPQPQYTYKTKLKQLQSAHKRQHCINHQTTALATHEQ
jgi:hypothetical protein